jgi:copper transport protein
LFITTLTLCIGLGAIAPAFGHAVLERSSPPANTPLLGSPREVALWFTESVAPTFSTVTVVDREGRRVEQPPVRVSGDQRGLIVGVGELPRGVYTVRWRVLSASDGHATSGFFLFAVGEALPSGLVPATTETVPPLVVLVRWIGFLAAIVLAGVAFFPLAVLGPALVDFEQTTARRIRDAVSVRLRVLTLSAGAVLLLSGASEFLLQAAALLDTSVAQLIVRGMFWTFLWGATPGWSLLLRASMTLVLLLPPSPRGRILGVAALLWVVLVSGLTALLGGPVALAASLHLSVFVLISTVYGLIGVLAARIMPDIAELHIPDLTWLPPIAAAGLLAGITMISHASGSGLLAIQADWLHLLAAAVWVGGLVCLGVSLRGVAVSDRALLARSLVPHFSAIAGVGLGVMVLTGLYGAWLHVPELRAFISTIYGEALGVKLLLVIPIAALGALNRFVLVPRIKAGAAPDLGVVRRLRGSISGELTLAAGVLLAVAVLTSVPPAKATLPAVAHKLTLAGVAEDVRLSLAITPAVAGWNRFEVELTGQDGRLLPSGGRVLVRLTKLDEDLDPAVVVLAAQEPGRYTAEGGELALPGWWEVQVVVRRLGQSDVSTSFALGLGPPRPISPSSAAQRLLEQVRGDVSTLRTWREEQQITDGNGGVVLTRLEVAVPDRLHYQTTDGTEAIVVGATRVVRSGSSTWTRDTLPQPLRVEGPLAYLREARAVAQGRQARCDDERCQVVLWQWDQTTTFAGWIGIESHRLHRLLMVAPAHYMTLEYRDFNVPIRIALPN